jgi:FAD/FMN-containing dehydrogenase
MELIAAVILGILLSQWWRSSSPLDMTVNDIPTGLNPIKVAAIYEPNGTARMIHRIQEWDGPISIGGGRFSMGGQIATENSLHIDMRQMVGIQYPGSLGSYNRIIVSAGTTWRQIIDTIHPYNRSVMVMQSYTDFTVGGSLSVNCHGRYANYGAVIDSVLSMYVVFANGTAQVIYPNRDQDRDVFNAIIGGYGGIALIATVELDLVPNVRMHKLVIGKEESYMLTEFLEADLGDKGRPTVLYNVNIVPPNWEQSEWVLWRQGKMPPEWKLVDLNTETNKSVWDIPKPKELDGAVFTLQEYFIPRANANGFLRSLALFSNQSSAPTILNLSIRGIRQDRKTILSWAQHNGYSFVIACAHEPSLNEAVGEWTRGLIDIALRYRGSFYLPYQLHATCDQFKRAYPRFNEWRAIKAKYDPTNRFRNKLWEKYMACT